MSFTVALLTLIGQFVWDTVRSSIEAPVSLAG